MIGSIIRRVQAAALVAMGKATPDECELVVQVATVVAEYVRKYAADDVERYQVLEVEGELVADLVNPATGHKSRTFRHASKCDGLVWDRWNSEEVVVEHKSTGEALDPWSIYWRRLVIDSQVSKYLLSHRQAGRPKIQSVLYDVAAKPTTGPKRITAAIVRQVAESGLYCGYGPAADTLADIRRNYEANKGKGGGFNGEQRETLELYSLRLRRMIADAPGDWLMRKSVSRSDDDLLEYAAEMWELAREIRDARAAKCWPRNTTHCNAYHRPCEYLPICCGEKSASDPTVYQVAEWVHAELAEPATMAEPDGGRSLLTNSRLTMFQSCRKRHELKYEKRIERVAGRESVALFWGSLFHELLELVWQCYGEENERLAEKAKN